MRSSLVALAFVALLSLPGRAAEALDPGAIAEQRFTRGKALLTKGEFAQALDELNASLELRDSPNTRLMIARCLGELSRYDDAFAEYQRAENLATELARTAPRYAPTRDAARAERNSLRPKIAIVRIRVTPASPELALSVNGRSIPGAAIGLDLPVLPGALSVTASAPGFKESKVLEELAGGDDRWIDLTLTPIPAPPPPPPPVAEVRPAPIPAPTLERAPVLSAPPPPESSAEWTTGVAIAGAGTAVVGGVAFAIFGSMARSRFDGLVERCTGTACASDLSGDASSGSTLQSVANVGLIVGGAGLTALALAGISSWVD